MVGHVEHMGEDEKCTGVHFNRKTWREEIDRDIYAYKGG
jgi:hypothetical protein